MEFQFPFPLLFRIVITSTLTMIIERKHQGQSNSIKCLRLFGEAATTPRRPGRIRSWPWVSRLPPALPGSCAAGMTCVSICWAAQDAKLMHPSPGTHQRL